MTHLCVNFVVCTGGTDRIYVGVVLNRSCVIPCIQVRR